MKALAICAAVAFEVMVTIHKRHEVMNISEHPACQCGDKHQGPLVVREGVWGSSFRGSSIVAPSHTETVAHERGIVIHLTLLTSTQHRK